MKILRVISSMDPASGGPCQGIRNSIPMMARLGVENEVLTYDSPDAGYLGQDNFVIHTIGPPSTPYAYSNKLHDWLSENLDRFDIVIIHGLWLHNSYGTFNFWTKYRKQNLKYPKIFLMPHGMLDPYFQKAPERRFKAIRNVILWSLIEKKVVNGVDGVLFTSQQELLLARDTFKGYKPKLELNIGYGIQSPPLFSSDMKEAFLKTCPVIGDGPYWLFLSRVHQKKGVDLLIKSYLKLKEKQPDLPKLVIAGPGLDEEFGVSMKKLASVDSDIIFTGMLRGITKWGAIYGAEVFILPSHQENFGIAVVEALACGLPVLISNQVNIWADIELGRAGVVFTNNEEGTYGGLKSWFDMTKGEKKEFSINALAVFKNNYTIESSVNQMMHCIVDQAYERL